MGIHADSAHHETALELASPYQWWLAQKDLLSPSANATGPYGEGKIWPFVIIGTRGYPDGLRRVVNEDGSDGTVRVAGANLNAVGVTIDFSEDDANPTLRPWAWRNGTARIPFAILPDRNHASITDPGDTAGSSPISGSRLGELILEALNCNSDDAYREIGARWEALSEDTADFALNEDRRDAAFPNGAPPASSFHQYIQVIVNVRDDHGQPVNDYFLEFFAPGGDRDEDDDAEVFFQREILEDVHVNRVLPSMRCVFADRTDLIQGYYPRVPQGRPRQLALSMSAANLGDNIRYFDSTGTGARGEIVIHAEDHERRNDLPLRLLRNTTHLVEIIIPRQPMEHVFRRHQPDG